MTALGRLKPDILIRSGSRTLAVIDAKYKRLAESRLRPSGVDRGDLDQLAAYLHRFGDGGRAIGMLAYPDDSSDPSYAATAGPWRTDLGNDVRFVRLPVAPVYCPAALGQLVEELG